MVTKVYVVSIQARYEGNAVGPWLMFGCYTSEVKAEDQRTRLSKMDYHTKVESTFLCERVMS